MKKNYILPQTEVSTLEMVNTLCASGTTGKVEFGSGKGSCPAL